MKKTIYQICTWFIVLFFLGSNIYAQHLDMVIFGNEASEAEHNVEFANSSKGIGFFNESYRKLDGTSIDNSWINVTVKIDPNEQNYITFKFWGSETLESSQNLFMSYWEIIYGSLGRWNQIGSTGSDEPEIVNWSSSTPNPNRFVYVTCLIPDDIIRMTDTLQLKLSSSKLPIYKAYTHTNSYFEPDENEQQGTAPEHSGPYPSPDGKTQIEHLHEQLDLAVDRFLTWQYYGEEWDTWVANGWGPEIMTGALNTHGVKDSTWTEDEYKAIWSARQNGHVRVQMPIETIALAFHKSWSKYYQDSTLIDRVVKALDFLRVAQGSDGGYIELENVSGGRWIGAPNRLPGVGSLMGFGMKGAPGAFLAMQNEIMTETLLNEIINEGDTLVTRRQAYINLFTGFRDYLTMQSSRGHASNQDIVNITAAYLANQCLISLDPQLGWPEETKQYWLDVCIGVEDGIYGGPWMSTKGTSLEANGLARGGWDSGYGEHNVEHLVRLANLSGEQKIIDYLKVHNEALARMHYLGYDNELRPVVRRDGALGWRKNASIGAEGYVNDGAMSAIFYNDQITLRGIQLAAEHGHYFKEDYSYNWVHLPAVSSRMMRQVDYVEQALDMPATDTRLPFEEGQPNYAWADEEAALIVIKDDDVNLWAAMQWRHPLLNDVRHVDNAMTNDKVRLRYTTPEYDLIATTAMQNIDGMYSLYIWQFGKYLVLMNASPDTEYEFVLPEGSPNSAVDLISEKNLDLSSNPVIQPQNTLILEWPKDLIVSTKELETELSPTSYKLEQNYPNPFNPTTKIEYSVAKAGKVNIAIYNILGQKVKTLVNNFKLLGRYSVNFNASNLPSGVYFYTIHADGFAQTKKMLLLK